jgi:hypothetical protein
MRVWLAIGVVVMVGVLSVPAAWTQPGPGGGLTVKQARASKLTGVLLVRGFVLVDRRGSIRLCERLIGAPPLCGGAALPVTGASASQLGTLKRAAGLAWSPRPQAVFGRLRRGRLVFTPNVR